MCTLYSDNYYLWALAGHDLHKLWAPVVDRREVRLLVIRDDQCRVGERVGRILPPQLLLCCSKEKDKRKKAIEGLGELEALRKLDQIFSPVV